MKKGFTVIEMLVVIFIVGVMSTTLIVNWRKNEKTYLVRRTAQEIAQNIRKAQDMALTGKKIESEDVPLSYGVSFDKQNTSSYIIFGDKNGNGTYQPSDIDINVETSSLSPGVEIYSLSTGNKLDIIFSIPDGFTAINPSTTEAVIGIRKTGASCPSSSCRNITIKNNGQISIQ